MKKLLALFVVSVLVLASLSTVSFAAEANTNVYNGNYSLIVVVADQYNFLGGGRISVEPNTEYIVSGWSKGGGSVLLRLYDNDAWGAATDLDLSGSSWRQSTKTITTGEGVTSLGVYLVTNFYGGTGTKYVDDIFIAKASEPDINLLSNGGFEDGSWGGYERAYSELKMLNGEIDPDAGDVEAVANTNVYDRNYSLKITNSNSDGFTYWNGNYMSLEPNTDYILSAWSKGGGNPNLRVLKPDWSGDIAFLNLGGSDWSYVSTTFNSGDFTQGIICFANNPWGSNGTMYVDNISVVKASDEAQTNLVSNPGFETGDTWNFNSIFAREYSAISMVEGQEPPAPTFVFTDLEGKASEKLVVANGVKVTTAQEGVLIIAAYADDMMITAKSGAGELSFTAAELKNAEEVRAFVVDGIKTLNPLVDAESIYE